LRTAPAAGTGPAAAESLSTELLTDWPAVYRLEPEWNRLLKRSRADCIFLTWEWVSTWARLCDHSVKPFVVLVRNAAGELVGLAPFYLAEFRLLRVLRYRTLRIMADYATGSEYPDWAAVAGLEKPVYQRILQALEAASRRWDCLWMNHVADWSGAGRYIAELCGAYRFCCHRRSVEFGYIELPGSFEAFFNGLSRNRRSELRRQRRKVLEPHQARITRCGSPAEIDHYLEALFALNHRRWKILGQDGTFIRKPGEAQFYRKFLPVALRNGWLRMSALWAGGLIKAVQVGYVYNGVYLQLQEGFDPDFVKGAGNILRARVIEECIAEKLKCYDFMGGMSEHKRRWNSRIRLGCQLLIGNRNLRNRLLFSKEIWPTGRYFRPSRLPAAEAVVTA
jgi:CelD/BcsL family acetyltransferase involved in cellulose biosynthesis